MHESFCLSLPRATATAEPALKRCAQVMLVQGENTESVLVERAVFSVERPFTFGATALEFGFQDSKNKQYGDEQDSYQNNRTHFLPLC